jgi:predicted small secreted protein
MTMTQTLKLVLLLLCCLMTAACSVPNSTIREEFGKSIKDYNKLLRWHEIENAGMLYQEPERRNEFTKAAADIKKREVTITDFRILTSECLPEKGTGEVTAEFDYYILPSNRIKTQNYHQDWVYRDIDEHKSWKVKSELPPFK